MKKIGYLFFFSVCAFFLYTDVFAVELPNTTNVCPTPEEFDKYDVHHIYTLNEADNGKLKFEVSTSSDNTYIARFHRMQGISVLDVNTGQRYYPDDYGNISIFGIRGGSSVRYEFFIADQASPCVNHKLGSLDTYVRPITRNQLYGSTACQNYITQCGSDAKSREAVPMCFEEFITGSQYDYASTTRMIETVTAGCRTNYDDTEAVKGQTTTLWCEYDNSKNNASFRHNANYSSYEYCRVDCTETLRISYDSPIATVAGLGFQYQLRLSSDVSCNVTTTKVPVRPTVCVPTCSCNGGKYNNDNDTHGGPNEAFDSCVKQCDGGKYTQGCIDSCYQDVYVLKKDFKGLSYQNKTSFSQNTFGGTFVTWIDSVGCSHADDCDATCSLTSCPADSVETDAEADAIYASRVAQAEADHASCSADASGASSDLTGKDHYQATVLNPVTEENKFEYGSLTVGGSGSSVTIDFPQAYIDKETGVIYYHRKSLKKESQYYYDGGTKFYTSIKTPSTNRVLSWPLPLTSADHNFNTNAVRWNILENIRNIGVWGQWNINVNCFYGLVNKYYCDDENCPEDTIEGGLQYIFRPIDLEDVFPNDRNPRWNWSCGATSTWKGGRYPITPVSLTDRIESQGNEIYDVSKEDTYLDYHIYLNTDTMRQIRNYNSDKGSYGKNDNYCVKDGNRTVCKSGLLDELEKMSGVVLKRNTQLIGCNNPKGNQCDYNRDVSQCVTYFRGNNYDIVDCKTVEHIEVDQ